MARAAIILIVIGFLVLIGANWFIDSQTEPPPPIVRDDTTLRLTSNGEVVGFRDRYGARAWLGIPFAEPPVDTNRWRAPESPLASNDVQEALRAGQMCVQFTSLLSGAAEGGEAGLITGEEDCLYLNIWSPPNAANLPVMFWIHGGGNTIGHGGSYSGASLATKRDVVVVTINYRLGLFGWFRHPALATGDLEDDSGNFGTLDTVRALEWVRENISVFGGNPNNITVFGESAGGFDTLALMASPLAKGLFHRAIVQSGGYRGVPVTEAENYASDGGHTNSSREFVAKLLVADGTVDSMADAYTYQNDMSKPRLRQYLYEKSAPELMTTLDGGGMGMIDLPLIFRDGHVLPDLDPEVVFSDAANHNMVPTILGTNRDEPTLFMVRDPQYIENWLGFLPRLKDPDTYLRIAKYGALSWKYDGVDSLARYMRQAGNPNVYAYRFDWDEEPSQAGFDLSQALGAAHGLEIPFAFEDFEGGLGIGYLYPNDDNQAALANSMSSYWSQFAYTGNPGQGRDSAEVAWTAWGDNGNTYLILDTPGDQGIRMTNDEVTIDSIKTELAADSGFTDPLDQCRVYVRNFRDTFDQAEYEGLNSQCANLDPDSISRF